MKIQMCHSIIKPITSNKTKMSAFAFILLLAMTLMMTFAQPGLAQVGVPQPVKTTGYISIAPTLIGVGQTATVNLWTLPLPYTYAYRSYFKGFIGITVTFTKPDGTKDTFMPVDGTGQYVAGQTQSLGAIYFYYAPNMVGDWSVSFTMPEQNVTDSKGTVIYSACTSKPAYFTVQTDPVNAGLLNGYPWSPLPNDDVYWSYPINSNNREWSAISGDWLGSAITGSTVNSATCRLWQPYGSGPNTAHIVWKEPVTEGGLVGGDYGSISYTNPSTFSSPSEVIMGGKVFANIKPTFAASSAGIEMFECIDQTTGEVLYTANGSITSGIHLPGDPRAQSFFDQSVVLESSYGSIPTPYLFGISGTTWKYYNPLTGILVLSLANVTASSYKLVDGTNLAYGTSAGKLFAWDLSKAATGTIYGTRTGVFNWSTGILWTTPLPASLTGISPSIFAISTDAFTIVLRSNPNEYWGYSAKDGSLLWNLTLTYQTLQNEQISLFGVDDFIVWDPGAATFKCYSMLTGRLLWTSPSFSSSPWATTWTVYLAETNDYNNLYVILPDGTIAALSLTTGQLVWRSAAFNSTEYPNNVVPYVCGVVLVGGNIYAYAGYSVLYQINPIPRHAMLVCINATTGDIKYTLNGGVWPAAAANGYVIGFGQYDGNLYCIGKGKTATSVTAPLTVVPLGDEVLVQGFVKDMSPGAPDTPAVSDEDMSEWMDYLYMQNATLLNNPPTPKGVTVRLSVVDPNSNCYEIGTATSDSSGLYKLKWKPEIEGEYTVYATFDGSDAYWGSYATTALSVSTPVATAIPEPAQTPPDNTALLYGILVAVIVAIVIGLLALFRKQK